MPQVESGEGIESARSVVAEAESVAARVESGEGIER